MRKIAIFLLLLIVLAALGVGGYFVYKNIIDKDETPDDSDSNVSDINTANDLQYILSDDGTYYVLTGIGGGKYRHIVVPSTHNERPVTRIGKRVFAYNRELEKITIPETIVGIYEDAFIGCGNLREIHYGGTVKSWCEIKGLDILMRAVDTHEMYFNEVKLENELTIPVETTEIPDFAFHGVNGITSLKLHPEVTRLGKGSFSGCTNIAEIFLYSGIEIDTDALKGCALQNVSISLNHLKTVKSILLKKVEILEGEKIPENAFEGCRDLTSLKLSASVTEIGDGAFKDCGSITDISVDEENPAFKVENNCLMNKSGTKIILGNENTKIPSGVTEIGNYAFDHSKIEKVEFPSTVTKLGTKAFYNCYHIEEIVIPETITEIGEDAFGNSNITKATLPAGYANVVNNAKLGTVVITSGDKIPDDAFFDCAELFFVNLPATISEVGHNAFGNCRTLQSINYSGTLEQWCAVKGLRYVTSAKQGIKIIINGSEVKDDLVLPSSIPEIGEYAFYALEGITSVTVSDGTTAIGERAFCYCKNVKKINISSSVTSIGKGAFEECPIEECSLPSVIAEKIRSDTAKTVKIIGDDNIPAGAFEEWTALESVTILSNLVTEIGDRAFYNCSSLKTVEISENVTKVGTDAFKSCPIQYATVPLAVASCVRNTRLAEVTLTNGEVLGEGALQECLSLVKINFPDSIKTIGASAFKKCLSLNDPEIPEGTEEICDGAFGECSKLRQITLPESLVTVHDNAFINSFIEEATIPALAAKSVKNPNLRILTITCGDKTDDEAFKNCSMLTDATVGVKEIGASTFEGCAKLANVVLPEGVETINEKAFNDCVSLSSLTFPTTITSIGANAFDHCPIEEVVTSTQAAAFVNTLPNLKTLTVRGGTSLGVSTFDGNPTLEEVTIDIESVSARAFANCPKLKTVTALEGVKLIDTEAFADCTLFKTLTLPESFISLGADALKNCPITTVNIPTHASEFVKCETLQSVTLTSGDSLSDEAFKDCTSLMDINLNIVNIGERAFENCTSLVRVDIPNNLTTIGDGAFENCPALTIYSQTSSALSGWHANWNSSGCPVVWSSDTNDKDERNYEYTVVNGVRYAIDGLFNAYIVRQPSNTSGKKAMTLPATISYKDKNCVVKEMHDSAFMGCNTLTSITFADHEAYRVIPDSAFKDCTRLGTVTLCANLKSIENHAFEGCTAIQKIKLPDTKFTGIGDYAFASTGLTTVTIPETVTHIGDYAFMDCASFAGIKLPTGLNMIGTGMFKNSGMTTYTVPAHITRIGPEVFAGSKISTVKLHNNIISIGKFAFEDCKDLTSIDLLPMPGTGLLTTISEGTFKNSALTSITIPDNVTTIEAEAFFGTDLTTITTGNYVNIIGDRAFSECPFLTSAILKQAISKMGEYVFAKNPLTSVTMENDVSALGNYAFAECTSLSSITVARGVKKIGNGAFKGCSSLSSVTFSVPAVGSAVKEIGEEAFADTFISTLFVPAIYETIGIRAFAGCTNLTSISLENGVKIIRNSAFKGCTNLTTAVLADTINLIDENAFENCIRLTDLYTPSSPTTPALPTALKTISKMVFKGCGMLSVINLDNIERVEEYAFEDCNDLTMLTTGASFKSFGAYAFKGCTGLLTLDMSLSAIACEIGANAFEGCVNLSTVIAGAGLQKIGAAAFIGCNVTSLDLTEAAMLTTVEGGAFDYTKINVIKLHKNFTSQTKDVVTASLANLTTIYYNGYLSDWSTVCDASWAGSIIDLYYLDSGTPPSYIATPVNPLP